MTLPGERGSIKDQTRPPQIASRAQQITTITYYFHNQSEVEAYRPQEQTQTALADFVVFLQEYGE